MSDGFIGFKALGWGAGALLAMAAIAPSANSQWNPLRIAKEKSTKEMQRPSLLKKNASYTGGTTTTATPTTTSTTTTALPELTTVPSNFDVMSELVSFPIPASDAPDVGAFRFLCSAGQVLADDPIVYPGQPGKSHLHQFFGNTAANANSTYNSLRTTGQSTCQSPVNRSGYWVPALLDGRGNVVRPDVVAVYYKRWPATDWHCNTQGGYPTKSGVEGTACAALPNGLRFIMGYNMLNPSQSPTGAVQFTCSQDYVNNETFTQAVNRCRALKLPITQVNARIEAPNCWDGKNLDSADHRSHVGYASYGDWGYPRCDTAHPYVIPTFTMNIQYTVVSSDDTTKWHFSSDEMMPGAAPGSTFHGDWFGAWDPTVMAMWTDNCINKQLNCSAGNLGNGYGMKTFAGFTTTANPRLVPIP
jgi:hypothetical protein